MMPSALAALLLWAAAASAEWTPPPCGNGPVTVVLVSDGWCVVATPTELPMVPDGRGAGRYRRATPGPTPTGRPTPACDVFGVRIPCQEPCERTERQQWTDWPECGGVPIVAEAWR